MTSGASGNGAAGVSVTGGAGAGSAGGGGGGVGGTMAQGGSGGEPSSFDVAFCAKALDAAALQLAGFRATYTSAASIPRSATTSGAVRLVGPGDWTSGFVAGNFWLIYEHTQDAAFRTAAEARTAALAGEQNTKSH